MKLPKEKVVFCFLPLLVLIALALFLGASSLIAQVGTENSSVPLASVTPQKEAITAADYCLFLNDAVADFLYDNEMSCDAHAGCIVRMGEPGSYRYCVVAGREEVPIAYLNEIRARYYESWLQGRLQENATLHSPCLIVEGDDFLASNQYFFYLPQQENSLAMVDPDVAAGGVDATKTIVDIAEFVGASLLSRTGDRELGSVEQSRATTDEADVVETQHPSFPNLANEHGSVDEVERISVDPRELELSQASSGSKRKASPELLSRRIREAKASQTIAEPPFSPSLNDPRRDMDPGSGLRKRPESAKKETIFSPGRNTKTPSREEKAILRARKNAPETPIAKISSDDFK